MNFLRGVELIVIKFECATSNFTWIFARLNNAAFTIAVSPDAFSDGSGRCREPWGAVDAWFREKA